MTEYYNLLSDSEAVIWIKEYTKKSEKEALQIVNGFRKSHYARGVDDNMKIHAEVLPGCEFKRDIVQMGPTNNEFKHLQGWEFVDKPTEHCLVSWLPAPLLNSVRKSKFYQLAEIATFKAESNIPSWYEVSFGSLVFVVAFEIPNCRVLRVARRCK